MPPALDGAHKTMKKTLYDVLNIGPDADTEAVSAAYRKLSARYRAERLPHGPESRNEIIFIQEAYRILSDPEKRLTYDISLAPPEITEPAASREEKPSFEPGFMLAGLLGLLITAGGAYITETRSDKQAPPPVNTQRPAATSAESRPPAPQAAIRQKIPSHPPP